MNKYIVVLLALSLISCSDNAVQSSFEQWDSEIIYGDKYLHRIWVKLSSNARDGTTNKAINIYIDGDGKPWLNRYVISPEPTVKSEIIHDLMAIDDNDAIYLGRPCYHGLTYDCEPDDWTFSRYSDDIVSSMLSALKQYLDKKLLLGGNNNLVLVGYSGGGTLAVLMAKKLPDVSKVITIAGNLDTTSWINLHGYTYLSGSINPVELNYESCNVQWYFFFGEEDNNIPYPDAAPSLEFIFPKASVYILSDVSHTKGWKNYYGKIHSIINEK